MKRSTCYIFGSKSTKNFSVLETTNSDVAARRFLEGTVHIKIHVYYLQENNILIN